MSPKNPKRPATPPRSDTPSATPSGDRIAKVLARAGVASRREAERMISEGRVTVNGKTIDSPALNVTAADVITVDDKPLAAPERTRVWMYHKPTGLVTTARDEQGRETIFDALPEDLPRVITVGRLDLNSEGLLLLTNDGELKRKLELPETGWVRKYRVRVKGNPTDASLAPLREGVVLDGEHFQPMAVSLDRQQGANAWLTVGLREGKNREIRRAMESVGLTVNRLIRISYGPFLLGKLASGAVEEIRPKVLRDQLGIEPPEEEAPVRYVTRKGRPARKIVGTAGPGKPGQDRSAPGKPGKGSRRILEAEDMGEAPRSKGSRSKASRDKDSRGKAVGRGAGGDKAAGGKTPGSKGFTGKTFGSRTSGGKTAEGKGRGFGAASGDAPRGRGDGAGKAGANRGGSGHGGSGHGGPTRGGPNRNGPGKPGPKGGKPPRKGPGRG